MDLKQKSEWLARAVDYCNQHAPSCAHNNDWAAELASARSIDSVVDAKIAFRRDCLEATASHLKRQLEGALSLLAEVPE